MILFKPLGRSSWGSLPCAGQVRFLAAVSVKKYTTLLLLIFIFLALALLTFMLLTFIFIFFFPEFYFLKDKFYFFLFVYTITFLLFCFYLFSDHFKSIKNIFSIWSKATTASFDWFYTNGYYCLKSGLYLDFYFKKWIKSIHKELNYFLGLVFLDKYILNKFINKFFINYSQFNDFIIRSKKKEAMFLLGLLVAVVIVVIVLYFFAIS